MSEEGKPTIELVDLVRDLLQNQRVGVLATHRDQGPYASLVAFAHTEDLRHLVFATTRATRKFANITADPRVAMLIDSRSNEDEDFHRAAAATVTGTAREPDGERGNTLFRLYVARHPHLEDFAASPTCALLEFRVDTYYVVTRFQYVRELHPWNEGF
jgi:nitroimidazol reductase NimA-like FMN-containing flavoprotein (pyridoxamine 5'-phosphate oxidase superfamily)